MWSSNPIGFREILCDVCGETAPWCLQAGNATVAEVCSTHADELYNGVRSRYEQSTLDCDATRLIMFRWSDHKGRDIRPIYAIRSTWRDELLAYVSGRLKTRPGPPLFT